MSQEHPQQTGPDFILSPELVPPWAIRAASETEMSVSDEFRNSAMVLAGEMCCCCRSAHLEYWEWWDYDAHDPHYQFRFLPHSGVKGPYGYANFRFRGCFPSCWRDAKRTRVAVEAKLWCPVPQCLLDANGEYPIVGGLRVNRLGEGQPYLDMKLDSGEGWLEIGGCHISDISNRGGAVKMMGSVREILPVLFVPYGADDHL